MSDSNPSKSPFDPFAHLPRLPRDPKVPTNTGPAPEASQRDTDPINEPPDSEKTPLEAPYGLKNISLKLDEVHKAASLAANESIATRGEVRILADALQALARRVTALEVSGRWAPLIISSIAIVGMVWTVFQLQALQLQIQGLLTHR